MEESDYPPSRVEAAMASGKEFVEVRTQISPHDRVAVVSYGSDAERHCGLELLKTNQKRVLQAIRSIRAGGLTAMGKGFRAAEKLLLTENDASARGLWRWFLGDEPAILTPRLKRVICLTDGHHNYGRNPLPIAERLKQAGVLIDCIGIGGSPSEVDEELLRQLASVDKRHGGVRYRFIDDAAELHKYFRQLATSITR